MHRIIALLLILVSAGIASAQILNIEKYRMDKDTFNVWAGNVGIGFSTKQQQTSVTTLNANSNLVYLSRHHSYMTINYIKFIGVEKSDVISEGYTHVRCNFMRKKFISYEPFLQLQYDLGRGLQRRELYGFSFRASLLKTPKFLIAFNTGVMHEHELWKGIVLRYPIENQPDHAETRFVKSTSNISIRGELTKHVNVLLVTYYQARFEKFFAPRLISDVQLNFIINKYFTLSNQFVSTLDALPILSNNKFVYSFNTNLIIKF